MSRSNNNPDHRNTKIFVGNLAWKTKSDDLRNFFQQFGEILDANVVCDTYPGRSKGYGFVVFRDAESAARVCENKCYVIHGREANVNMAYLGVKNNTNQSIQNGSFHEAVPLHQFQLNSPLQFYWNPYDRQFYAYVIQYHPYYSTTPMNWRQTNAPTVRRKSSPRIENIDETNQADQQVTKDQEGESISEDNAINQLETVIEEDTITEETLLHENRVDHEHNGEDTLQGNGINEEEEVDI